MLYLLSVIPGYNYTREFWLPISGDIITRAAQPVITVDHIATVAVITSSVNIESHLARREDYQIRAAE